MIFKPIDMSLISKTNKELVFHVYELEFYGRSLSTQDLFYIYYQRLFKEQMIDENGKEKSEYKLRNELGCSSCRIRAKKEIMAWTEPEPEIKEEKENEPE